MIHGKVDRQDYTVGKVNLETYPGFYLTGSLYHPQGPKRPVAGRVDAPRPLAGRTISGAGAKAVRQQIVEGAERFELSGRYPLQARCVQLARMGCVVFHYDMVGYADSGSWSIVRGVVPT